MNRSERRNLDHDLRKLMMKDGDRCTVCHADLPHNGRTYYGQAAGAAVIAGECCRSKLTVEVGSGLYVQGDYDVLSSAGGGGPPPGSPDDLEAAICRIQQDVAGIDGLAASAKARAGITGRRGQVSLMDTPWKADDAAWFQAHPDRAHRLRPLLKGELESFPAAAVPTALPSDHEIQIVIRQVEPGQRIRMPFGRNLATPIPDIEAVTHALFDAVSQRRDASRNISVEEVAALAKRYDRPPRSA